MPITSVHPHAVFLFVYAVVNTPVVCCVQTQVMFVMPHSGPSVSFFNRRPLLEAEARLQKHSFLVFEDGTISQTDIERLDLYNGFIGL